MGKGRESDYDHLGSSNSDLYRMQKDMEISSVNEMNSTDLSPVSPYSDAGYIEHPVSKFDTLAGVAIKYGVEVADIKKMNALVSDLQMFALKSLQIPTPGKHPLSPRLSDDLEISRENSTEPKTSPMSGDLFDSFQSLRVKSPILKSPLEGHHAHISADQKIEYQGSEMTAYRKGESNHLEVEPMLASLPHSNSHQSRHRKSRSLISGFADETSEFTDIMTSSNDGGADPTKGNDKLVRRRQKSIADFSTATEKLFKKDNCNGESSMTRKSLDLRLKATKSSLSNGGEVGKLTPIFMDDAGNSIVANGLSGARKSSSTSSLPDPEKGSYSSMWSTSSWNLKTDLQPLSSAVVTKSFFDAMQKPMTRFKASMD